MVTFHYFCQTLFESKFAITPEEATIRKLPVQYEHSEYVRQTYHVNKTKG